MTETMFKRVVLLVLLINTVYLATTAENVEAPGKIFESLKKIEKMEKQILKKQNEIDTGIGVKPKKKSKRKVARNLKTNLEKKEKLEQELTLLQTQYMDLKQERKKQRKLRMRRNHHRNYRSNRSAIKIARMQQRIADLKEQLNYNNNYPQPYTNKRKLLFGSSGESEEAWDSTKNLAYGATGLGALGLGVGLGVRNNRQHEEAVAHVRQLIIKDNMVESLYTRDINKLKSICDKLMSSHSRLETSKSNIVYRLNNRLNQLYY